MKVQWVILIISALTDFVIVGGTALGAVMMNSGEAQLPNEAAIIVCIIGGTVAAARTIQQALKVTPETSAQLRGE